jgi:uncharacterized membrane protein
MILALFAVAGTIFAIKALATRANQTSLPPRDTIDAGPSRDMHASVLMLGIDWHARAELQTTLARLAASGDTGTPAGRARLLSESVLALRRAELSWLYVGFKNDGWCTPGDAEAAFKRAGADLRARFQRELVRSADGRIVTNQAGEQTALASEGPGVVVVSLVVVCRVAVHGVRQLSADAIRRALSDRGALSGQSLVALEVVWSPAAEDDRMSTAELEQHYPELRKIDPASIAGRLFCAYCSGPFPMELLKCPHCGAPAPTGPDPPDGATPA